MSTEGMNAYLAAAYGTAQPQPQPGGDDAEKVAHAELFAKLAADQGIDLSQMSEQELSEAWNTFYGRTKQAAAAQAAQQPNGQPKTAGEHGHNHGHKHKEAKAEFARTKEAQAEWQTKVAEADFCGRVMAHSYVDELKKIAAANASGQQPAAPAPGAEPTKTASLAQTLLDGATKIAQKQQKTAEEKCEKCGKHPCECKKDGDKDGDKDKDKGGKPNPFAGHQAPPFGKKASALDELAAKHAIVKAAGVQGVDPKQVSTKLAELLTNGPKESTKIAGVANFAEAVEVRSLELLEQLGFKVEWPQG